MGKCVFLLVLMPLLCSCGGESERALTEDGLEQIPFAQRSGLPEASGGFVLAVGGETVTADEIVVALVEHFRPIAQRSDFERFKRQVRAQVEQVITTKISNILLYQEAKRQAGEDIDEALEKAAEAEVRKFIVSFEGDYARAEEALKQMGKDWQSFKESQKKMILSQWYIASQLPENEPVTHSELIDYYNKMRDESFSVPAMIRFRLIDIEAGKLELADANKNRQEQARELADELMVRLRAGEDFGSLAKQYSHGYRREFGGLWRAVQPGSLAEPYDVIAAEAERIEPGQIAGPVEAREHIFIMKLEEKKADGYEPFEKVQNQVEAKIIFDRRKKVVEELEAKLVQQAALGERGEFVDFCVEEIYRFLP